MISLYAIEREVMRSIVFFISKLKSIMVHRIKVLILEGAYATFYLAAPILSNCCTAVTFTYPKFHIMLGFLTSHVFANTFIVFGSKSRHRSLCWTHFLSCLNEIEGYMKSIEGKMIKFSSIFFYMNLIQCPLDNSTATGTQFLIRIIEILAIIRINSRYFKE